MSIPKNLIDEHPELGEWCILSGYRGSIAHGTYIPSNDPNSVDDKDAMYICVSPIDYYYGLKTMGSQGTKEIKYNEWDIVVYEARKFLHLLSIGNPNVLMLLWLEPNFYINKTAAGQLIITHKYLFVGKHVYKSFTGYAYGQLHRMTHHTFHGHMGTKRKQLVEKYGYDCKNASHLIRLLKMSIEFLTDGELHVLREDATQLIEIKKGEWTLEQVKTEADRLFKLSEETYIHSKLPKNVDLEKINQLAIDVVRTAHQERLYA